MMQMVDKFLLAGKETILTALPLYHIFAFTVNLLGLYHMGGRNIVIPNPRPPSNMKKAFEIGYPIHCQYSLKPTLSYYFLPKFLAPLCYENEDFIYVEEFEHENYKWVKLEDIILEDYFCS